MRWFLLCLVLVFFPFTTQAQELNLSQLPSGAQKYIPLLLQEIDVYWPAMNNPSYLCAQIETETCYGLKSKRCWNPTTELKTSREYGFGLGQLTIAYDSKGRERFNNFNMVRELHEDLRHWKWRDRYNVVNQIRALILYNRKLHMQLSDVPTEFNRYAMMFASYNGGYGGLRSDQRLCRRAKGCDDSVWFNNVALYSNKSKKKYKGYGKSFFEINRDYVEGIMYHRRLKYIKAGVK